MTTIDAHRAYLALLAAVIDGNCDERAHDLLCRPDDPHFGVTVAHHAAHQMVASIDTDDHQDMRHDIATELLELADDG